MKHQHSFYKILTLILSLTISTPTIGAEKEHISKPQSESKEVVHKKNKRSQRLLIYGYIRTIYGSLLIDGIMQLISQYTSLMIERFFTIPEDLIYTQSTTMTSLGDNKIMVIFRERKIPLTIIDLKTKQQIPYSIQLDEYLNERPTAIAFFPNPAQTKDSYLVIGTNEGRLYSVRGNPAEDRNNGKKAIKCLCHIVNSILTIEQNPYKPKEGVITTVKTKVRYIHTEDPSHHAHLKIQKKAKIGPITFSETGFSFLTKVKNKTFIYTFPTNNIFNYTIGNPLSPKSVQLKGKNQNCLGMVQQCEKKSSYHMFNSLGSIFRVNEEGECKELKKPVKPVLGKMHVTWLSLSNNQYLSITSITDRHNNRNNILEIWQKGNNNNENNTFSCIGYETDDFSQALITCCIATGSLLYIRGKNIAGYKIE